MPSRLSQWDLDNLTPDEQSQIVKYKDLWDSDPTQRESANAAANAIRQRYGYSGAVDGSQFVPVDTFAPPETPGIPEYKSPYEGQINALFNKMQNQEPYKSPYENLINQQLSQLVNRPQFSYDPDTDSAYQAFRERALRAGDKAYSDNLAGLSAMTGGRANSWAGTVASQARNQYVLQAEEAVLQFEDRAYSRYRDETQDMHNLLGVLNSQDEIAYSRYRDSIGDTKDLADMVFRLEERDFERFKYMSDQQWKVFDIEYNAYKDSLDFKREKIAEAIDRTNLQGYVNNQDSIVLGVPTGTLSQAARERAEAMEDYIQKSKIDLENEFKAMEEKHKFDIALIKEREASDIRVSNATYRGSGGSGGLGGGSSAPNLTKTDGNDRDKLVNNFRSYVESKDFQRLDDNAKYNYIADYIGKIVRDHADGLYGKNGDWIASQALAEIENTEAFRRYYQQYEAAQNNRGYIEHPMDQFSTRYGNKSIYDNTGSHRDFIQSINKR